MPTTKADTYIDAQKAVDMALELKRTTTLDMGLCIHKAAVYYGVSNRTVARAMSQRKVRKNKESGR